jgi:hypothetical protein
MQNQTKPFATIVSIIIILNILATFFIGFVAFYYIGVGDPTSNTVDIGAFIKQKHMELVITKALTMFFIIGFIVSMIIWLKGKRYWNFILSGLALLHILVLIYCIAVIWLPTFFHFISALDLAIVVIIFLNRRSQYSSIKT